MATGNLPAARSATGGGVEAIPVVHVSASGDPVFPGATSYLPDGVDRSGSIAQGGNQQTLAIANPQRKSLSGQNISAADLWINEAGNDAAPDTPGSYKIGSGGTFNIATARKISIFGVTTGQKFTATET